MNFSDINGMNKNSSTDVLNEYQKYATKSEGELMQELLSKVNDLKKEGKFDIEQLEKMYSLLSANLNSEQRTRMRNIIDMLKG